MGLLSKLFKTKNEESGPDLPVVLDVETRQTQLGTLISSLDTLSQRMRTHEDLMENPGWRARVAEYDRIASEASQLRATMLSRETLLDLAFQVRPVFTGTAPEGLSELADLQASAMAASNALVELMPGERV